MKTKFRLLLPAIVIALTAFAVACGGDDSSSGANDPTATTSEPTATTEVQQPTSTPTPADSAESRGASLFSSEGCSACHATDDNRIVGPGLKGVGQRAAALGGDEYLAESIKDPSAVIADGYPDVMTEFRHLDDGEIADLVAYLNSLD